MIDNDVTFAVKCFFRSVYSVGVFLSISVSVQVAQGLTVRELDLGRVVDWRADELKHRFPHVCRDEIQHTRFHYSPAGTTGGTSAAYFAADALSCVTYWVCCGRYRWLIHPTGTGRRRDLLASCCPGAVCRNPKSWMCDPPENGCEGQKIQAECLVVYNILECAKFTLNDVF